MDNNSPTPVVEPPTTPDISDETVSTPPPVKQEPKPALRNIPSSPEHHDPVALLEAHKSTPKPAIAAILAVIIALAIAGLVIFVFMQSREVKEDTPATTTTTTQQTTTPANSNDVDTTSTEVDDALNTASDTTDFNSADLSDTSLGL